MPRAARTTRKKTEVLSESTSLEFHVDKCGERYKQMNEKLDNLSKRIDEESKSSDHKFEILFRKVDDLMMKMTENQASQNKMLMGLLAGIITIAPFAAKDFVVSRPMPEYTPVTIAIFFDRSMSLTTSKASVFELNPELIGF